MVRADMDRICQQTSVRRCPDPAAESQPPLATAISTSSHQTAIAQIGDAESIRDGIGPHITILRP